MEARERKFSGDAFSTGSALILTVVLTSMLAIVGILFVMMARVDKVATSAISENRELDSAVETVIAGISQQLVSDVPGVAGHEYYDYPDASNAWLASLEPMLNDGGTPADPTDDIYYWQHISDVNNQLGLHAWGLPADFILDYQSPTQIVDSNAVLGVYPADADADGVSDSVWIKIPNITSSKGEPIYAAVRVVDNGAMLNVNTAYKFDPCDILKRIDGSSQLQINLMALAGRPIYTIAEEEQLLRERANFPISGIDYSDLSGYEPNVIWHYYRPNGAYTPFDISDELEMRYRYLLNHTGIDTRLEAWGGEFRASTELDTPVGSSGVELDSWFYRSQHDVLGPNDIYSYRHLATTYNMDRIIDPDGDKMINVNREIDADTIYDRLLRSNLPLVPPAPTRRQYAQLAANMVDFIDDDAIVTIFGPNDPLDPNIYYGFEAQPFINEVAWKIGPSPADNLNFFALELFNPFNKRMILRNNFVLELVNREDPSQVIPIIFDDPCDIIDANSYFVIANNLGAFTLYNTTNPLNTTNLKQDPALKFFENWISSDSDRSKPPIDSRPDPDKSKPPIPQGVWGDIYDVSLKRLDVPTVSGAGIYIDNQIINDSNALLGSTLAFGRDDRDWRVIYQTPVVDIYGGSLGMANYLHIPRSTHLFSFFLPNPLYPRAEFITVGDIPRILTIGHGGPSHRTIGQQLWQIERLGYIKETDIQDPNHMVRLHLQNPLHSNVFQYLTVFDPMKYGHGPEETKVKGRININTAPWYVIAQLPWVTNPFTADPNNNIAKAIVAYRDKVPLLDSVGSLIADYVNRTAATGSPLSLREDLGFASIGELNFVTAPDPDYSIWQYQLDPWDLGTEDPCHPGFPDLTTDGRGLGDGVLNDFEERDVIFSRISNLVTVRSDVFTAYILVRIGADGPQKRVVAILDRSNVKKPPPYGKVRIVALHYVPDPR